MDEPSRPTGANSVRPFLLYLARQHAATRLQYDLKFVNKRKGQDAAGIRLRDFVSWLVVRRVATANERGILWIIYDEEKIVRDALGDQDPRDFLERRRARFDLSYRYFDMVLGKILLHEGAHIVLHLTPLQLNAPEDLGVEDPPKVSPGEENEAWFLAMAWWGMLIGDRAYDKRSRPEPGDVDDAWLIS
ncbi:MAG: hypothetical protein HY706_10190 [Candidatus Hydrogenedentes bacterium]|nr:hypothetical protein [Candidatus Hydrogenedentota bacterium]